MIQHQYPADCAPADNASPLSDRRSRRGCDDANADIVSAGLSAFRFPSVGQRVAGWLRSTSIGRNRRAAPAPFRAASGSISASAIAVDGAGNSVVTGHITGTVVFGSGELNETTLVSEGNSLFVAKFDVHGALLWARAVHRRSSSGRAIAVDVDGKQLRRRQLRFGAACFLTRLLTGPASGVGDFFVAKFISGRKFHLGPAGRLRFRFPASRAAG